MKQLLIELAKKWPGHEGVNYETTTEENLIRLIADAVDADRAKIKRLQDAVADARW